MAMELIHNIERSVHDFDTLAHLKQSLRDTEDLEHAYHAEWRLQNYDEETTVQNPNDPEAEAARLENLLSYNVLDTLKDPELDELTADAKNIFQCQIAAISMLDFGRQWFKSICGLEGVTETSREVAFCNHTMHRKRDCGVLVVPDATLDERFWENPLVTGGLNIRFYAGAPIRSPEGHVLGVFCILDDKPRPHGLSEREQDLLQTLADNAMATIIMDC